MKLWQRINYYWRIFATGWSFSLFGIGGIFLAVLVLPLLRLISPDPETIKRRTQRLISAVWALFIWQMKWMGVLSWEIHGREALRKPGRLIVANHPSLLDVVFLISQIPKVDCVVKPAVLHNPFMVAARWAGYIAERSSDELVRDCSVSLQAGNSLMIFPEGTRTKPGQPISMRRGAAQIALAADCEILPVTIRVNPTTLTKGQPWWHVPPRKFHVTIVVGEPIVARDFLTFSTPALAARHLTQRLERYFTDALYELENGVPPPRPKPINRLAA